MHAASTRVPGLSQPVAVASRGLCRVWRRCTQPPAALGCARTRGRAVVAVRASAAAAGAGAGAPSDDPYAVLGVHPLAGAEEFARARSRKVTAAGDDAAAVAKLDAAYDAIMMRQLALRMKGQGPIGGIGVSKEVAFADRESLLPAWAPKKAVSPKPDILVNAALAAAMAAWALLHPLPGLQPMYVAVTLFFFRVNAKMVALFPSPSEREAKTAHEGKRMLRTIGLTLGACAAGIAAAVAVPSAFVQLLGIPLPGWIFIRQDALVNVATALALFLISSFTR